MIYLVKPEYWLNKVFDVLKSGGLRVSRHKIKRENLSEEDYAELMSFKTTSPLMSIKAKGLASGLEFHPLCPICDKEVAIHSKMIGGTFFRKFCSSLCSSKSNDTKTKRFDTKKEKYGAGGYCNSGKIKTTKKEKYGSSNYNNKEKRKQTNLEKHGLPFYTNTQKRLDTFKLKFNRENPSQRHISKQNIDLMANKESIIKLIKEMSISHVSELSILTGYTSKHVSKILVKRGIRHLLHNKESKFEFEFREFIETLGFDNVIYGTRGVISPLELDVFFPDYKLAVELDGVYWHSENNKNGNRTREYHLNKSKQCEEQGIQLLHIWDNEWNDPTMKEVWKSVILAKLRLLPATLGARKCSVVDVDSASARTFCENNHLQGYCNSSTRIGLEYNGELMCLGTFSKSRFNKDSSHELVRFCTKTNTVVQGGFSKIMSEFKSTHKDSTIVSYANRRWSTGSVYSKNKFTPMPTSDPNYFYTRDYKHLMSRQKFQKHKLGKMLDVFDSSLTEWENMKANGYDRIWDCGNLKFLI